VVRVFHLVELLHFSKSVQKAVTEFVEQKESESDREVDAGEIDRIPSVYRTDMAGWTVSSELRLIQRYVICMRVIAGIFVMLLAYCLMKLSAAYVCEESVWNMIGGCVTIPDDIFKPDVDD